MKPNSRIFIAIIVGALAALACGAPAAILNKFEKGEISFVNPAPDGSTVFHNYGVTVLPVEITLNSTFESSKVARLSVDGVPWTDCNLEGNGRNTSCPTASIQTTGVHTISAQVQKIDGTLVTAETSLNWAPYSPLEQSMQKVAGMVGQDDPKWGFNIVGFLFSAIATVIISKLTGGSTSGVILGGILLVVGLFYWAPPEVTTVFVRSIYGIFIGYFAVIIFKSMHFFHARRADGASVTYVGPGGENGRQVIDSMGQHGDRLMGHSRPQLPHGDYPPLLPESSDYVDRDGIRHTVTPRKGILQRLLGE